ncbi:MAG: hypothetical protein LKF36_01005 [Lactobacillus sp.]|jgi:VIT1/CCC1 family predicted Fe2+/Mn2+ transporter|nr:hypothetical protein [Lactobacillus sp.]
MKNVINLRLLIAGVVILIGAIGSTIVHNPRSALGFIVTGALFMFTEFIRHQALTKRDVAWVLVAILAIALSGVITGLLRHDFKAMILVVLISFLAGCATYFKGTA